MEHPKIFLTEQNTLKCEHSKTNDGSDEWLFIEQSKKVNMKFVIENGKTGKVLEEVEGTLIMEKWKNRDSQLWTLAPQNKSGYSLINVASG